MRCMQWKRTTEKESTEFFTEIKIILKGMFAQNKLDENKNTRIVWRQDTYFSGQPNIHEGHKAHTTESLFQTQSNEVEIIIEQ